MSGELEVTPLTVHLKEHGFVAPQPRFDLNELNRGILQSEEARQIRLMKVRIEALELQVADLIEKIKNCECL